jgi:hypothetical protein
VVRNSRVAREQRVLGLGIADCLRLVQEEQVPDDDRVLRQQLEAAEVLGDCCSGRYLIAFDTRGTSH